MTDDRSKQWKGITFYAQLGEKLEDYQSRKVTGAQFNYDINQHTLICGECDFSFSASLISKRGGSGVNVCCTSWYYYKHQWFEQIRKSLNGGFIEFDSFLKNLKYCKRAKAKITFGIDAKHLLSTETQWCDRDINSCNKSFDRIIFTFPRIFNFKDDKKWNKIEYNQNNQNLLMYTLKSMKSCLNDSGEIHLMLFKEQFFNWKINKILNHLGLKLFYWTELNKPLLRIYFNGYIPRDGKGNIMKLKDDKHGNQYIIYFCSFVKDNYKYINYQTNQSQYIMHQPTIFNSNTRPIVNCYYVMNNQLNLYKNNQSEKDLQIQKQSVEIKLINNLSNVATKKYNNLQKQSKKQKTKTKQNNKGFSFTQQNHSNVKTTVIKDTFRINNGENMAHKKNKYKLSPNVKEFVYSSGMDSSKKEFKLNPNVEEFVCSPKKMTRKKKLKMRTSDFFTKINDMTNVKKNGFTLKSGNVKKVAIYVLCPQCGLYNSKTAITCTACYKLLHLIPCRNCGLFNGKTLESCDACYQSL